MNKKKIVSIFAIIAVLLIAAVCVRQKAWAVYVDTHDMVYHPANNEEEIVLAYNWGIVDRSEIKVDAFLFSTNHEDKLTRNTLLITGITDLERFFGVNMHPADDMTFVGDVIAIGGAEYSLRGHTTDYFGGEQTGCNFTLNVDYARLKNNGEEDIQPIVINIYVSDDGTYCVECGMQYYRTLPVEGVDITVGEIFHREYDGSFNMIEVIMDYL